MIEMVYEESKDKEIFSEKIDIDKTRLIVSVHSYNNGEPKLQISREFMDKDGKYINTKLGRFNKRELDILLPIIQKAKELLNKK